MGTGIIEHRFSRFLIWAGACLLSLCLALSYSFAESDPTPEEARGRYSAGGLYASESGPLTYSPFSLDGGSSLTLISPKNLSPIATLLAEPLESTHKSFTRLFGQLPQIKVSLRLMEEEVFFSATGAPRWTNALFYRGQIMIPIPTGQAPDMDNINRSIKHEYAHAIIGGISNGKCPGWLDEGLAQWAEGPENPSLRGALARYLVKSPPVPFSMLKNGFTRLERSMVAPAYAQSLIAANAIMQTYGFGLIRKYLDYLGDGESSSEAFVHAFKLSETDFEERLGMRMLTWAKSSLKKEDDRENGEYMQMVFNSSL